MDSGSMIDRRIVVKMLITYFERHHSQEVLDLMTKSVFLFCSALHKLSSSAGVCVLGSAVDWRYMYAKLQYTAVLLFSGCTESIEGHIFTQHNCSRTLGQLRPDLSTQLLV